MIDILNCPLCNLSLIKQSYGKVCKNEEIYGHPTTTFYHYCLFDSLTYCGMSEMFIIDDYIIVNYINDEYFTVCKAINLDQKIKFDGYLKCDRIQISKFLRLKHFW